MNRRVKIIVDLLVVLAFANAASARERVEVEAFSGEPFGVAHVVLSPEDVGGRVDKDRLRVEDAAGRAHYPSVVPGLLGRVLGAVLNDGGDAQIGRLHVSFLFTGDTPFKATLYLPGRVDVDVVPERGRKERNAQREHARLLEDYWGDYQKSLAQQTADGDYPPLVQTYLTSMLSRRLGLPLEDDRKLFSGGPETETQRTLELLVGLEKLHNNLLKEAMRGRRADAGPANHPLPAEWKWPGFAIAAPEDVPVEPMAKHVPAECFYIRFGSFGNYVWLDDLLAEYGGDLGGMVTLRAFETPMAERGEKQLSLEKSVLGDLFGPAVIADVAFIGRDTFLEEGGAFGIVFQARNGLLGNDILKQQQRGLAQFKDRGAKLEKVTIAGHEVSFLSTPDHRLRSFHAADGEFHLVTTSRAIVERFYEAGQGKGALADTAEFRHARQQLPLAREDSVFAFFSTAFFQGLLSPQYQVELHRRQRAIIDLEVWQLAQAAAHAERLPADVPSLIAAGLLPADFGNRPDGSRPEVTADGLVDSLRGPRGTFLPIPDVPIKGLTVDEAARCQAQLDSLRASWGRMDPLMVGVRRFAVDKNGRERIIVDANISPLDETKYGRWLSLVGPKTTKMVLPLADDAVTAQAIIQGGDMFVQVPTHLLFLGVKDLPPLEELRPKGLLGTLQLIRNTPGYIGGWPKPGFLDLLPFGLGGQPDPWGFSQLPFGIWRWQGAGFSAVSLDQTILARAAAELRVVDAEIPAQLRVHAGDISASRFAESVNSMSYQRSLDASRGNTKLMHVLVQQLRVPVEESQRFAEQLLDAKLKCPLGGEYFLTDQGGDRRWVSTKVLEAHAGRPADYKAPLLEWFRGADLYLVKDEPGIRAHAELEMQRKPSQKKLELPLAPLLNFNLFGNGNQAIKPKEPIDKPPPADVKPTQPPAQPQASPPPPKAGITDEQGLRSILKQKAAEPAPVDELPPPVRKTPAGSTPPSGSKPREF